MQKYSLLQLREKKGISRYQLADAVFIDMMTLYQFEKGNSLPNIIDAMILAKFYNKKIDDIQWNVKEKK